MTNPASEALISHMVNRFLSWKLPKDFNPDDGISFEPKSSIGTRYESDRNPIGTNLFTYAQAEAMVRHMLEGSPSHGALDREAVARIIGAEAWARRDRFAEILRGEGAQPLDDEHRASLRRSAENQIDTVVAASLAKADLVLALCPAAPTVSILENVAAPAQVNLGEVDLAERIAQWLHDETGHPDSFPNRTWPEHANDTGQRGGGFVKIVPSDAQAHFREIARRLVKGFRLSILTTPTAGGGDDEIDEDCCADGHCCCDCDTCCDCGEKVDRKPPKKAGDADGEEAKMLGELLARIHRDGGQYIDQHGLVKAVADADLIVAGMFAMATEKAGDAEAFERAEIEAAIKKTEYKYFGDYEMSDDQHEAVDQLVLTAKHYLAALTKSEGAE